MPIFIMIFSQMWPLPAGAKAVTLFFLFAKSRHLGVPDQSEESIDCIDQWEASIPDHPPARGLPHHHRLRGEGLDHLLRGEVGGLRLKHAKVLFKVSFILSGFEEVKSNANLSFQRKNKIDEEQ